MADFSSAARFFGIGRSKARRDEPDAADLGTAFGLDLSLDSVDHGADADATLHDRTGWLRRFTQRSADA